MPAQQTDWGRGKGDVGGGGGGGAVNSFNPGVSNSWLTG